MAIWAARSAADRTRDKCPALITGAIYAQQQSGSLVSVHEATRAEIQRLKPARHAQLLFQLTAAPESLSAPPSSSFPT